jgi:protein phosphatase
VSEAERARTERVAVVSDVHGNVTAFEAVLADIDRRGIETVVNLGDTVGKGPRGSACIARARKRCAISVQGNWDEWLGGEPLRLADDDGDAVQTAVRWWQDELTPQDRAWLRGLPFSASMEVGDHLIRFLHASVLGVWNRVWQEHTDQEAAGFFGSSELIDPGQAPDVVCYGDLHGAYLEQTPRGLLVNVGSVGNPLDEPRASYVVLEPGRSGIEVHFERVAYDIEAEAAVAVRLAMPQREPWIRELREAHYRGRAG